MDLTLELTSLAMFQRETRQIYGEFGKMFLLVTLVTLINVKLFFRNFIHIFNPERAKKNELKIIL